MGVFTLDTSGAIRLVPAASDPDGPIYVWSDLSPFAQGYIEAAWQEIVERIDDQELAAYIAAGGEDSFKGPALGFSNLAPETLAAILKDCEAFANDFPATFWGREQEAGREFWATRQRADSGVGFMDGWLKAFAQRLTDTGKAFPPLTPYLDDTGKVRLREAG